MDYIILLIYLGGLLVLSILKRKELEWIGPIYGKRIRNVLFLEKIYKKVKRPVKFFQYISLFLMFFLIGYSYFSILGYLVKCLKKEVKSVGVSLLIPGMRIPGTQIKVPLIEGLISIFLVILTHELAHAIIALERGESIKSIGIGVLGFIPVAFVELGKELSPEKNPKDALFILSAGPTTNFLIALLFLCLLPIPSYLFKISSQEGGVKIIKVEDFRKGIFTPGEVIKEINGTKIKNTFSLLNFLRKYNHSVTLEILTNKGKKYVKTIVRENRSYIGIYGITNYVPKSKKFLPLFFLSKFFYSLFYWIYFINLAVCLINAYPIPFFDGGGFFAAFLKLFINRKRLYSILLLVVFMINIALLSATIILPLMAR